MIVVMIETGTRLDKKSVVLAPMEIEVKQMSEKWFELRRQVIVTASKFGDAIGVGKGKPYDFLLSLEEAYRSDYGDLNSFTSHGREMEPIIHEAYELLTGNKTRQSGFWVPTEKDTLLKDKIGASPDAVVMDQTGKNIGLCEFKAAVHSLYRDIPRQYMVQIQGQMAITELPWCDFMAICRSTREIMLRRVHFCPQFWDFICQRLNQFCAAYQDFIRLSSKSGEHRPKKVLEIVKSWPVMNSPLPFELQIKVTNLLRTSDRKEGNFSGPSGHELNFDLLMGSDMPFADDTDSAYFEDEIRKLDESIEEDRQFEEELSKFEF